MDWWIVFKYYRQWIILEFGGHFDSIDFRFFFQKARRARGNSSRVLHQVDLDSKPPSPDPREETQHFHAHSIRLQPKIHFPKHSFRSMNMHRNIATQTIDYCMGKFQEVRWIVKIDSKNSLRCRHTSQHSHTRHMQRRSDQCIASRRASRLHATWSSDESTTLANSMLSLWTQFAIRCDAPLWGCHWTSKSHVWHNETVDWIDSIGKSHWYICHGDVRGDRKSRNKRRPNDDLCFSLRKISQFDLTEINHMVDWRFYFEWLPFALRWICHCFRDLVFFELEVDALTDLDGARKGASCALLWLLGCGVTTIWRARNLSKCRHSSRRRSNALRSFSLNPQTSPISDSFSNLQFT